MNLYQWSNPSALIGLLSVLVQAVVVVLGWRLGRLARSRLLSWVLFLAFSFMFFLRFSLMLATLRLPESPAFGNIQDDAFRLLASVLLLVGLVYVERLYKTRSKMETAWRDSEQRFSYFADNGPMIITIKDEAGRYVFVNKLFEKTFQKTSTEVLGKTPMEVWSGDDSRLLLEHDRQVLKTNAPLDAHEFVPTPDGGRREWRVFKFPFTDVSGGCYVGNLAFDFTEHRQAERALRDSERRFRSVWDSSADAMRVTDCHGRIVAVNAAFCRMMNMDASQLEGQPLTVTQQAEQHKDVMEHHLRLFASHSVDQPYERKLFLRSGGTLDVEISSAFIELENEPPLMLSIYRDITERRQAEEQRLALERKLLDSQKLESLGILAGGIAHDFNNLLTAVMGNTELAMMELSETSPTRPYLEEIEKTTLQAADLCRQMLAYSGRGKFVIQRVGVNGIIEEMTHLLQISISKKNMLKFHLSPGLPAVEVDAAQMRQVIMNLVINASEAIGDKSGVITVSTGVMRADADYLYETYLGTSLSEGDYVYIEVSDTGCGMSSSTRTKIFDPFFTTKFTGRGLGLAAVLGIVRGHKGCLKVYSETGRGSTFKFLLPCAPGGPSELSGQPAGHALWHGSGTVLVVDDEETVRTVTARMLEKFGFKVLTASDGQQGVDVYRKHTKEISVVVLDMTMPRLSGEEAFTEMRRIRPDARVILTSGYNEQDATNRFAGKGLAGFLQKPFKPDVLYEKLMTVIGKDGKDGEAPKKT